MLEQVRAVLFDLDGTLMDSMWMWTAIDREYLGRFGFAVPADLAVAIEGMGFTETAMYFKERFCLPDSVEEIKAAWGEMAYEAYAKRVPLKPGAAGFLRELKKRGIQTAIASSNSQELIGVCLANNGVTDLISEILTSCEVPKGKPAPDVYLEVAARLGVPPENCLVFEDVPMGILAGKNAGMKVCAMEDDFSKNRREEIRRLADYYIRSYDEVLDGTYEVLS